MPNSIIQPRTLKGFRDHLPESMIPRERLMEVAREVYRGYGFSPIDTPALEYAEILCGKGSDETDKQMFRFIDHGKRDVGMRFDLTVPLARFVAQHGNALGMPFKRYHIGPVWRGENTQAGRYREFAQCDFDTIGTTSVASDIETGLVIYDLMRAIGFDRFTIRVNNRKVLNGLLQKNDLGDHSVEVLRALDKLAKIGPEKVKAEMMATANASAAQIDGVMKLTEISGDNDDVLRQLQPLCQGNDLAEEGFAQLQQLVDATSAVGVTDEHLTLDVSIARGLDYYTGTIFETFLDDLPEIGSVCSGGRYDDLAQLYTKQQYPGIGASLGLDRLLTAMQQLKMIDPVKTTADVMVVQFDAENLNAYLQIAASLRRQGIKTEVFPEAKKLKQQFKYADRQGFGAVIVAGSDELEQGKLTVKTMADKNQVEFPLSQDNRPLGEWLKEKLGLV